MIKWSKSIINIVASLLVVLFGFYIQMKTEKNMAIIYVYCFYQIVVQVREIINKK